MNYTNNESFIKLHQCLMNDGIVSEDSFLKLYNKSLMDVDPYNASLTENQIREILFECSINPWYFIREVVRIPNVYGTSESFNINKGSLAILWAVMRNINIYVELPQLSYIPEKTMASWFLWVYLFSNNTNVDIVDKSQSDVLLCMERVIEFFHELPAYIKNTALADVIKGKVTNIVINSTIQAKPTNVNNAIHVDGIGRSVSSYSTYFNSFAFTKQNETIFSSTICDMNDICEQTGMRHNVIITSTPGKLDSNPAKFAYDILKKSLKFDIEFLNIPEHDIHRRIHEASIYNMLYIKFSYNELGFDEDWREFVSKLYNGNKCRIDRELLLLWDNEQQLGGTEDGQ